MQPRISFGHNLEMLIKIKIADQNLLPWYFPYNFMVLPFTFDGQTMVATIIVISLSFYDNETNLKMKRDVRLIQIVAMEFIINCCFNLKFPN